MSIVCNLLPQSRFLLRRAALLFILCADGKVSGAGAGVRWLFLMSGSEQRPWPDLWHFCIYETLVIS